MSLDTGLASARVLFCAAFQPSESLKAMTYFEGGDLHTLPKEDQNVLIAAASAVRELPKVTSLSATLAVSVQDPGE